MSGDSRLGKVSKYSWRERLLRTCDQARSPQADELVRARVLPLWVAAIAAIAIHSAPSGGGEGKVEHRDVLLIPPALRVGGHARPFQVGAVQHWGGDAGSCAPALLRECFRFPRSPMSNTLHIIEGGLDDARVIALLHTHVARARAETAPGSAHALDLSSLHAPEITFWSAWVRDGVGDAPETLAGVGALKRFGADHGEIKSMHTAEAMRGQGIGAALLRHIVAAAEVRGMTRVSLETGSWPYFAPARALYARHGFAECPPFGDYRPDPNSVFMTLTLPVAPAPPPLPPRAPARPAAGPETTPPAPYPPSPAP